ncbi:hypothetical protein CRV08_05165 [Halarcobacter ebronensis]|uniref:PD-(D/E)XK endonuclease-like domain-containing protein n=1 Tax=Halarcobacter ebronensis TaxID=1462615 RepID=A0A4V1LRN6_9BACT|nr:PD-(D/E)XK nuclease family protein [Halarcobacter ebronensis]RXJ68828.1 hypothetical protein CRV08_05165 [Halarcobacter ebronensis]
MQSRKKLLVFPTSRSIREYVNSKKEFNTLLPSLITIDEFFKKSLLFNNRKYLDEDERVLYLKEAVKNVNLNALGINSSFNYFIKQSDYIYRFFIELASENVDIDSIVCVDTYGFYSEHLSILKEIQSNYLRILDEKGYVDRVNISKYYSINRDFINRYESIELYFEGYFTNFEFQLVKEISKLSKLIIEFYYYEYNQKSIEKFINENIELEVGYRYKIDFSNKVVIEKEKIEQNIKTIDIKGFSSQINQIAFIKKTIVDLVNNGIEPSKIALILPNESFASTIQIFDNEGYFNYAMGLDIYTSNLFRIIDGIYAYMNENEIKNIKNLEFIQCDITFIDNFFKKSWNSAISEHLFEDMIEYFISKESNKELLDKFKELVYKLYKIIFSYGEKIKFKDAYKIFYQKVSQLTLDDVNSGKITVMGLLESRRLEFDAIIICDFNESLIPKRSKKDKFLSTRVKNSAKLPTSFDRENLQKYYYKRLIDSSKNIIVSYEKNDNEQISRFANDLFKNSIESKVFDNNYKHILYKNKNLTHFDEEIILDIDLSKITWSASSLKEFLECKRKYYLNHILKIKEHDISLKPKGYELGSIVHSVLEEFYKQKDWNSKKIVELFDKYRSKNSFLNMDLQLWKRRVVEFISFDLERIEENNITILELEKPFLIDFNNIKIRGTIDRIEKQAGNSFNVIDYKTSSTLKVDTLKNYEKSTDFQLEFYYLALKELYKSDSIRCFYYDLYELELKEEIAIDEKIKRLEEILSNLSTTSVNFEKCESLSSCQFCIYKDLCNR